ncbi:MAG: hypothetical protein JWM98_2646, partial [Thermoleophilia bacterium]|nr:hypothetical protein [Thermoleophilia bacterium]
ASGVLSATYNSLGQEVSSPDSYPVAPGFSQVTPELALLAGPYWWQVRSRDTVVGDMWSGLSTFRVAPYIKKLRIENAGNPGVVTTVGHPNAVISAIWFDNFENGRAQLSLYRGTKLVYRSAKVRTEDPVTDPRSEDGVSFTVRFTKAGKPAPLNVRLKAVVRVTSGTYGANAVSFFKMPTCIDSSC